MVFDESCSSDSLKVRCHILDSLSSPYSMINLQTDAPYLSGMPQKLRSSFFNEPLCLTPSAKHSRAFFSRSILLIYKIVKVLVYFKLEPSYSQP